MSIFNPNDYNGDFEDVENSILSKISDIYLKKNGGSDSSTTITNFSNDLSINGNIICNSTSITPIEISQLNNIDVNIKNKLDQLNTSIGGVFTQPQTYSNNNIYLGNNTFSEIVVSNNGVNTSLNSVELSYLNNTTSNIQTQINNKTSKILNPVNNNLVSMDINGNLKNNDVQINTDISLNTVSNSTLPSTTAIKMYVDTKINNISQNTAIGKPKILYLSDNIDTPTGYKLMDFKPINSAQDIEIITLNNNRVLINNYISTNPLNITKINGGIFSGVFYCYVDDATSLTRIEVEVYVRTSTGTETLILTMLSNDINILSVNSISINATLMTDITTNLTDKLVFKVYGMSSANKNIILYYYHGGSQYNSFINTSISESHNDLNGLNIGDFQHLSQQQKTKCTQLSSVTDDGLLSSNDYNIFNNKENAITLGTTSQYFRGDKSFQNLTKTTVNLGNVDNTSDINKPISTLTQNAINLKNDLITTSTNLTVNNISDISGNLRTAINNLTNKTYQILYVAYQFGVDTNTGYVMNLPKKTIQSALDDPISNSGINIIILPFVYPEALTINKQNISIASIIYEKGGLCNITGDINITSVSSSVRLSGLTMNILNITGNCNVYIDNCRITTLNKTSTGYLEINNSNITSSMNFNAIFTGNFMNNNLGCQINTTVNCSTTQLNFSNNLITGVLNNFLSGIIGMSNSVCYSVSNTTNAITASSCILYLSNMTLINPDNSNARLSLTNCNYSINNTYYNKAGSTITTSNKLNRNQNSEILSLDTLVLNGDINITGLGSIQPSELYALDNVTSNIQQQLNNLAGNTNLLSSNNTFTGTNDFNNYLTLRKPLYFNLPSSGEISTYNIILDTYETPQTGTQKGLSNIIIGRRPCENLTTGNQNIGIGYKSLKDITTNIDNIAIGTRAGENLIIGNSNIFIGNVCRVANNDGSLIVNNSIAFGNEINLSGSNQIAIGNNISVTTPDTIIIGDITKTTTKIFGLLTDGICNTQSQTDNSTKIANTSYVHSAVSNMVNENLTDCNANTQLSTDNSTKIATTAFITNKLSGPNTYVGTVFMSAGEVLLTTGYSDFVSITIPVNGTYEINIGVSMGLYDCNNLFRLFNNTSGLVVPNSEAILSMNYNANYTGGFYQKSLIIENLTANTVIKLQVKRNGGSGVSYIYGNVYGPGGTYMTYKMLGLTTNVITTQLYSYVNTVYLSGTEISIPTSYTDYVSITIPVNGTYEINMNMAVLTYGSSVLARLFNSTTGLVMPNTEGMIERDDDNVANYAGGYRQKSIIIENLTANTVLKLQVMRSGGNSAYIYGIPGYGISGYGTSLSYKMLGTTTNVITPLKWTYKYTVDAIDTNPFLFGPGSIYAIGNAASSGQGGIGLYNKSGVSMVVNVNGLFNSTSAFYVGNSSSTNTTLANNGVIYISGGYAIYLLGQYIEGYFNDITNNRHFKYSFYYYAQKRAIVNIEQIIV